MSALDAQRSLVGWRADKRHRTVHLCNSYTLSLAARSSRLEDALNAASLNLPDGRPVVWMANLTSRRGRREPVAGPDLFEGVLALGQNVGLRHYLYGGRPSILSRLVTTIGNQFPEALVVGAESPPAPWLDDDQESALRSRLLDARPDVVWVALGTPAQDLFIETYLRDVPATFVAIGAAFDFLAGARRRAPRLLRRFPGEWLFRLSQEPRRLWRRYLIESPLFFYYAVRSDSGSK